MKSMNRGERALLLAGLSLLALYAMSEVYRVAAARVALARFKAMQTTASSGSRVAASKKSGSKVDFSLWSEARIKAYLESLATDSDLPVAILRIAKLHIEVPVFDGTDDLTLNRGAGRIIGTGLPGEGGNIGISAHRDGFFRALKDVRIGDSIELELADGKTETYLVDEVQIVMPENVEILRPRAAPSVTLVTCYPFYFIGSAPKRFIVQGSLQNDNRP